MTAEELSVELSPIIEQLETCNSLLVVFVALFGVIVGALLALLLFRRF